MTKKEPLTTYLLRIAPWVIGVPVGLYLAALIVSWAFG